MPTSPRLRRRIGAAVLLAAVLAALLPAPAWAHATLVGSSPQQGERIDELPTEVRFEFSEDMSSPAYVILTAPDGTSVTTGEPKVDGPVVTQDITNGADGAYTMAYRAVSEDGHPLTGEITFSVGTGGEVSASPESLASADESDQAQATSGTTSAEPSSEVARLSRHQMALSVGMGLFLLAALLLLLARRAGP